MKKSVLFAFAVVVGCALAGCGKESAPEVLPKRFPGGKPPAEAAGGAGNTEAPPKSTN